MTSLSLAAALGALGGCARHVVLDPETVERINDRAWTVKSEPRIEVLAVDGGGPR